MQLAVYLLFGRALFPNAGELFEHKRSRAEWQTVFPKNLLRLIVVLAAGLAGPVCLVGAGLFVLFTLTSVSAMGVPYLAGNTFPENALSDDGVIRRNYKTLSRNPFTIWQKRGNK